MKNDSTKHMGGSLSQRKSQRLFARLLSQLAEKTDKRATAKEISNYTQRKYDALIIRISGLLPDVPDAGQNAKSAVIIGTSTKNERATSLNAAAAFVSGQTLKKLFSGAIDINASRAPEAYATLLCFLEGSIDDNKLWEHLSHCGRNPEHQPNWEKFAERDRGQKGTTKKLPPASSKQADSIATATSGITSAMQSPSERIRSDAEFAFFYAYDQMRDTDKYDKHRPEFRVAHLRVQIDAGVWSRAELIYYSRDGQEESVRVGDFSHDKMLQSLSVMAGKQQTNIMFSSHPAQLADTKYFAGNYLTAAFSNTIPVSGAFIMKKIQNGKTDVLRYWNADLDEIIDAQNKLKKRDIVKHLLAKRISVPPERLTVDGLKNRNDIVITRNNLYDSGQHFIPEVFAHDWICFRSASNGKFIHFYSVKINVDGSVTIIKGRAPETKNYEGRAFYDNDTKMLGILISKKEDKHDFSLYLFQDPQRQWQSKGFHLEINASNLLAVTRTFLYRPKQNDVVDAFEPIDVKVDIQAYQYFADFRRKDHLPMRLGGQYDNVMYFEDSREHLPDEPGINIRLGKVFSDAARYLAEQDISVNEELLEYVGEAIRHGYSPDDILNTTSKIPVLQEAVEKVRDEMKKSDKKEVESFKNNMESLKILRGLLEE